MSARRLFSLTLLLAVTAAWSLVVVDYVERAYPPPSPGQWVIAEVPTPACVPARFTHEPQVNGLGEVQVSAFPGSRRLSYLDQGASQYVVKATSEEVQGFYDDRMRAGCWERVAQRQNEVAYAKGDAAVRLALLENPISGKVIIDYRTGAAGEVMGESAVFMAQTSCPSDQYWCGSTSSCKPVSDTNCAPSGSSSSCSSDQVWCTSSSGGGWCQMPPCPSPMLSPSTTPPPSPSCSGAYQQSGSTSPSCNYSTCSSGCTWGSDGCPNGCNASTTPPPSPTCSGTYVQPGTPSSCNYSTCPNGCNWSNGCPSGCYAPATCTGEYQQAGSAYPMCNYSKCPNGCNYGSDGCPASCYASSGSGSCSSGYQWCASSYSCIPSGSACGGGSTTTCPSGQYWCGSTNSCKPNSDTNCSPGGGGSSCPSGQYTCNGACISTGSYCAPYGGTGYPDKASCESSGGRWCQPTTSPHCHGPGDSAPCEADVPGGGYSCPSGQYMCNGACVANTTSCSSSQWPMNQSDCSAQGKYWCTSSYAGGSSSYSYSSGWCQSTACSTGGGTSSCASGSYYCPSTNSCVPSNSTCGSSSSCPSGQYWCGSTNSCKPNSDTNCSPGGGGSSCSSGQYWCSTTNSCISNASSCPAPLPVPAPQPIVKCGQCQVAQGSSCVQAPVGTLDPLCNGGQCDMYGGCVNLSGGKKLVGRGAICGDNWCNVDKGEDSGNCPQDKCTNAPAQTVQPPHVNTLTQPNPYQPYPGQTVYPQGPHDQQYPYGPQDQQGPQGPQYWQPSEEEMARMRQEQCQMMKRGMKDFMRGVTRMQQFVNRLETRLKRQGIGIPAELKNALAKAPELVKKFEVVQSCDEVENLVGDMEDIAMAMQEWGPRLGELEGLAQMIRDADRQSRQMYSAFKRVERVAKRNAQLVDDTKQLEAMLGTMSKKVKDAKELAKADPEAAIDLIEEFFADAEEYWSQQSLIEMMTNLRKGLASANTELTRAKQRIRALERKKDADPALVAEAKDLLAQIEDTLPALRTLVNTKGADLEEVKGQAEEFWQLIEEFENLLAAADENVYAPRVRPGQGFDAGIPEGFIMRSATSLPEEPPLPSPVGTTTVPVLP